jgi:hypothetical protein
VREDLTELAYEAVFLSAFRIDGSAFVSAPWAWTR